MFQIMKNEPKYFKKVKLKIKDKNNSSAWSDVNIANIRTQLRAYILKNEQADLCAYCEKSISDDSKYSNIDHYKTRKLFPRETLNYDNLLVSCNSKINCSFIKDNYRLTKYDYDNIINPVIEDPNNFFEYSIAGDILIKSGLASQDRVKAEFTIKIFSLNNQSIIQDRARISSYIIKYKEQNIELSDIFSFLNDYKSFTTYIYNKL